MSEPILTITVPGRAVSANARLGHNRRTGAVYLTKAAREWRDTVIVASLASWRDMPRFAVNEGSRKHRPLRLPLRIVCHVYGTRADGDNLLKLILDGLKVGIGVDDKYYRDVEIHTTAKGIKEPRTVIEVWEAAEEVAA